MSFHNVKLESSSTSLRVMGGAPEAPPRVTYRPRPGISAGARAAPRRFALWVLHAAAPFRVGLARPLSRGCRSHDRHLSARYDGPAGLATGLP
jgi:hypothetical protein